MASPILEHTIVESSIIIASEGPVSANLAGEAVIMDPNTGMYYGLNEVGAQIWELIQESKTVGQIRDAIVAEYEVEPEQCTDDILGLLQDLAAKELIEVKDSLDA
jgi:hypothetical protein